MQNKCLAEKEIRISCDSVVLFIDKSRFFIVCIYPKIKARRSF